MTIPEAWLIPDWPAPDNITALCTTRQNPAHAMQHKNKKSFQNGFDAFNVAQHVGDDLAQVDANRNLLAQYTGLHADQIYWLNQVHGNTVINAGQGHMLPDADASYTNKPNMACVVMTADCLPVLMCDDKGSMVAAVHAGWRSLASGIISKTLKKFPAPEKVMVWLGPAISQDAFEVGEEVKACFCEQSNVAHKAFKPSRNAGKWMANLYQLARDELSQAGVEQIFGGQFCTFQDEERFYSFRRDGSTSGRMASLIYLK